MWACEPRQETIAHNHVASSQRLIVAYGENSPFTLLPATRHTSDVSKVRPLHFELHRRRRHRVGYPTRLCAQHVVITGSTEYTLGPGVPGREMSTAPCLVPITHCSCCHVTSRHVTLILTFYVTLKVVQVTRVLVY